MNFTIVEMVHKANNSQEDLVELATGAWNYEVDNKEFVRELRRPKID